MAVVVERTFRIRRGSYAEFERLSRGAIWPYMEARGCKILGLYQQMHGGPSNEIVLLTAYDSMTHWESTRPGLDPPPEATEEARELWPATREAVAARQDLVEVTRTRVLRLATEWFEPGVEAR